MGDKSWYGFARIVNFAWYGDELILGGEAFIQLPERASPRALAPSLNLNPKKAWGKKVKGLGMRNSVPYIFCLPNFFQRLPENTTKD